MIHTFHALILPNKETLALSESELLIRLWEQVERDVHSAGGSISKPPSFSLNAQARHLLAFIEMLPTNALPGLLYRIDLPERELFSAAILSGGLEQLVWSILRREALKVAYRLRFS